jgi:hypothetical protein
MTKQELIAKCDRLERENLALRESLERERNLSGIAIDGLLMWNGLAPIYEKEKECQSPQIANCSNPC